MTDNFPTLQLPKNWSDPTLFLNIHHQPHWGSWPLTYTPYIPMLQIMQNKVNLPNPTLHVPSPVPV